MILDPIDKIIGDRQLTAMADVPECCYLGGWLLTRQDTVIRMHHHQDRTRNRRDLLDEVVTTQTRCQIRNMAFGGISTDIKLDQDKGRNRPGPILHESFLRAIFGTCGGWKSQLRENRGCEAQKGIPRHEIVHIPAYSVSAEGADQDRKPDPDDPGLV